MNASEIPDYVTKGDGDITIFLLHGAYGSKDYWRNEITYFVSQGYRVVAWDAPGYGQSLLPEDYSIELLARECVGLIEHLGSKRNIIVGHSMGGLIAPKVYEYRPDLIHAMVISATVASMGHMSAEFQETFIRERIAPLDHGVRFAKVAGPLVSTMMYSGNVCADRDLIVDCASKTPEPAFRAAIAAIASYKGAGVIEKLDVPTLFIAGRHDPIGTPDLMREMSARVTGSEFVCIENAGHYAWAEQADDFNQQLLAFLARNNLKA
ncbi:MAG: alpha/beta fold hydrolase [SAR86 cluster bacterium]|jgi:3-oxoadipate enol-lactonase|uniref:Alpha/beta fold hydrolase n=1 Tax=SAR86 cluster bacterium TaxID=2030880 RepID=A0A972VZ17_9GAMM|nr:alpha/beta fold hydrolase [SAR86 cluster bacterium]|tara:strand:+ start:1895 stop:2689 length:795 start_codon:yes stop_codon:yes gene_type:complete